MRASFATIFEGQFIQGSFILGKTQPGNEVFIDKEKVRLIKLPVHSKNPLIIFFKKTISKKIFIKKI